MEIDSRELTAQQAYKLITGVVVPRPIAWVTTLGAGGQVNLAPFSAFTFVSTKPPMVGINVGRKAGVRKDTANNIHEHGEFVVNIADETMIEHVHLSAIEHAPDVSEVEELGLEVAASSAVRTPALAAAPVSLECRLHRVVEFGDTGSEFIVGEILRWRIRDGLVRDGKIDTLALRPIARIAGPRYAKLGEIVDLAPIGQTEKTVLATKP